MQNGISFFIATSEVNDQQKTSLMDELVFSTTSTSIYSPTWLMICIWTFTFCIITWMICICYKMIFKYKYRKYSSFIKVSIECNVDNNNDNQNGDIKKIIILITNVIYSYNQIIHYY